MKNPPGIPPDGGVSGVSDASHWRFDNQQRRSSAVKVKEGDDCLGRVAREAKWCLMNFDAREIEEGGVLETDLCIVGAGAAGISIAREFDGTRIPVAQLTRRGETGADIGQEGLPVRRRPSTAVAQPVEARCEGWDQVEGGRGRG